MVPLKDRVTIYQSKLINRLFGNIIKRTRDNQSRDKEMKKHVSYDPSDIPRLIKTLDEKSTARFKAAKELQIISLSDPAVLYPYFRVFSNLLDSKSGVLLWNGIIILSHLAKVDSAKGFDAIFDKYYQHLWDGKLVTAANILGSSGRIARFRHDLAGRITEELLKVDIIPLPTAECREVARGHVLVSLAEYPALWKSNSSVHDFILRCASSHRPAVKERAAALLTEYFNERPNA